MSRETIGVRSPRGLVGVLVLAAALAAGVAVAQEETVASDIVAESSVDVIPISDGVLVLPREDADFERLEISGRGLYLDGVAVSSREVRERLGALGERLLDEHGSAQRRERFPAVDAAEIEELVERAAEAGRTAEEIEERIRERLEELEELREDEIERWVEDLEERGLRGERYRTSGRVVFGRPVTIERDESTEDVVVIGGSLEVLGEVRGDAVVVGGPIRVEGDVDGSVTSVGASVRLGADARVGGDAVSVGNVVRRESGARVRGEILELKFAPEIHIDPDAWEWTDWDDWGDWSWGWLGYGDTWGGFFGKLRNVIFLGFVVTLCVGIAGRPTQRIAERLGHEPGTAVAAGILAQVLFAVGLPLVCLALLISIVGILLIPLVVPLAILAFIALSLVGYTASARVGGDLVRRRFGVPGGGVFLGAVVGVLVIQGWSLLGQGLSWTGGPIFLSAVLLLVFGFFVRYFAWTAGLGAVILDRFSPGSRLAVPPPPPPAWDPPDGDPARLGVMDREWDDPEPWDEGADAGSEALEPEVLPAPSPADSPSDRDVEAGDGEQDASRPRRDASEWLRSGDGAEGDADAESDQADEPGPESDLGDGESSGEAEAEEGTETEDETENETETEDESRGGKG